MSEVKRLEMDHKGLPFVDDNGVYVLYENYAELKAQRDALAGENAALKEAVIEVSKSAEDCEFNGDEQRYVVMPDAFDALTDLLEEIPATDACLNSVRAEAVEQAAEKAPWLYGDQLGRNVEAIPKDQLIKWAAQLRAGEPS